ncbi:hypothetical protein [Okeania sp. SIO1I7]|uniref:hypothetical protein n=1 Tax=Okeania sp. SIO1I7 TaxID=2607772 RepID=UPI0013F8D12F|nr:hypothetical protein [Okeania sp. SIO1I7]NET26333.1 hypothetical protein [Okeania sp. SIO1I7]
MEITESVAKIIVRVIFRLLLPENLHFFTITSEKLILFIVIISGVGILPAVKISGTGKMLITELLIIK